jgi:hypothetical protein
MAANNAAIPPAGIWTVVRNAKSGLWVAAVSSGDSFFANNAELN